MYDVSIATYVKDVESEAECCPRNVRALQSKIK